MTIHKCNLIACFLVLIAMTGVLQPGVASAQEQDCSPAYPGVCIPPKPPDLDCADLDQSDFAVPGRDPHDFDVDGDGVGCEGGAIPPGKSLSPLYVVGVLVLLSLIFGWYTKSPASTTDGKSEQVEDNVQALEHDIAIRRREIEQLSERQESLRQAVAVSAEQERAIHKVLVGALEDERRLRLERESRIESIERRRYQQTIALTIVATLVGFSLTLWLR